jgi:hypothetical protein
MGRMRAAKRVRESLSGLAKSKESNLHGSNLLPNLTETK